MSKRICAVRLSAGLAFAICSSFGPFASAEDVAPISAVVNGQQIGLGDIASLVKGMFAARANQIPKEPSAMPSDAPLIYYAGNGTIWVSKKVDQDLGAWARVSRAAQPAEDAFVAAVALAAMDAGTAGKAWEDLYRRTPPDPASRLALGMAIAEALKTASDQSAAFAADQTTWMQSHLVPGATRASAYALLKSRNLVAYNGDYAESRSIGDSACLPPLDPASGTWPYANEPLPKLTGLCATFSSGKKSVPNPDALVKVAGALGLGCEESILTTISFGTDDRVSKVTVAKPETSCI